MTKHIKNILLIDDEEDSIFITSKLIQSVFPQIKINSYQNPLEAISYLELNSQNMENLPDLILLDLNMPLMNGWMFLESFGIIRKGFTKEVKVFLLTSSVFEGDIKKSETFPIVSYYLQKPIDMNIFEKIIINETVFV